MLYSILFKSDYLLFSKKSVPLQCVFHSIRFKVNKGWSKALLLFLCLYLCIKFPFYKLFCYIRTILLILNYYYETLIYFNPETSTYLQSFSTESLRQDNQVEIYEGNADVIYVPIEPMN